MPLLPFPKSVQHRLSSAMPCSLTVPSFWLQFKGTHRFLGGGWKGAKYGISRVFWGVFGLSVRFRGVCLCLLYLFLFFLFWVIYFDWLVLILRWVGFGKLMLGDSGLQFGLWLRVERLRFVELQAIFSRPFL